MWIVNFPAAYPPVFVLCALAWSVLQGCAGYLYGQYIFDANRPNDVKKKLQRRTYGWHHAALYFVCSFSGFGAWSVADLILQRVDNWAAVAVGTVSLLIALVGLSVLGISGALARLLYLGNLQVKGNLL